MAVTIEQVRAVLEAEEPDYEFAARLGAEALPHLEALLTGPDVGLAVKAASLAGRIGAEGSLPVLERAAGHDQRVVRVAAAAATRHVPRQAAAPVLDRLLDDPDEGVRRMALESIGDSPAEELRDKVARLRARGEGPAGRGGMEQ